MKKWIGILLSLSMVLALTVASAISYTAEGYYTIEYPISLMLDDSSYVDENTEDITWLFMLGEEDYLIDAYLTDVEEYTSDFSLSAANSAGRQAYYEEVTTTLADQNPELITVITSENGVVFYIFHMVDAVGPYLYAETIEAGMSVNFFCYYFDTAVDTDDTLLEMLATILYSFSFAGK